MVAEKDHVGITGRIQKAEVTNGRGLFQGTRFFNERGNHPGIEGTKQAVPVGGEGQVVSYDPAVWHNWQMMTKAKHNNNEDEQHERLRKQAWTKEHLHMRY